MATRQAPAAMLSAVHRRQRYHDCYGDDPEVGGLRPRTKQNKTPFFYRHDIRESKGHFLVGDLRLYLPTSQICHHYATALR
jgi:hypothetical protein